MQKNSLRKYLKLYHLIIKPIREKKGEAEIRLYGRMKRIVIPDWCLKIEEIFQKILNAENNYIIKEIVEKVYRQGIDDKKLFLTLPITESGYYRLKRKFEEKVYELFISSGDVTQNEILENKLIE